MGMMSTDHHICNTIVRWLTEPEPHNPHWPPEVWESFQFVCRVHGTAPLLHENLSGVNWLEPDVKNWLAGQYQFNALRIAKMHSELQEILVLFAQHQIPLMPLKGSILSANFYDSLARRPMADLDLLIRPADFESATRLLAQLGYERDVTHWKHTEFVKPNNRRVVSKTCEHPDNPRTLEIHRYCRETFGGPTVDLTELMWANASEGELLGQPAILPGPEALWLHLLVHATYHLWQGKGRLIHLVDLALLTPHLRSSQSLLNAIDARYSYPALALLVRYFPAAIDDTLPATQRARVSPKFRQWVDSLDLVNTSYLNPNPPGLYLLKALKFSQGRPREVLQALRFALLPGPEEIALDHPRLAQSKVPWLAYALLPIDWAKRLVSRPKT